MSGLRAVGPMSLVALLALGPAATAEPAGGAGPEGQASIEPEAGAGSGGPGTAEGPDHGRWISAGTVGLLYGGLTTWAYFAWYRHMDEVDFSVGGDGWFGSRTYAGGADKLGHLWANNAFARTGSEILIAGGWDRLPASLAGSALALGFFTYIEVKDGFYYSFSPGDAVANAAGAALSALMINVPRVDELIDLRVEYRPSREYRDALAGAGDVNVAEDYSGQIYHLALHLGGIGSLRRRPVTAWMRYVDVVAGYQAINYKPEPGDPDAVRRQSLFVGAAVNMQAVLDRILGLDPGPRQRRGGHWAGHLTFEMLGVPYGSLRLVGLDRSPEP